MNTKRESEYLIRDLLLKLLLVMGFVAILVWLFPTKSSLGPLYQEVYRNNLNAMRVAADSYYTNERLPQNVGDSIRMSLGEMLDKHLLLDFVDKNGKKCDYYKSYVEISRTDSEYELKVNLACGEQEAFIIEHIGCYDKCPSKDCEVPKEPEKEPEKQPDKKPIVTPSKKVTEYQFKKVVTSKDTYYSCPKGYTLKNKVCYKTVSNTEKKAAKPISGGGEVVDKNCTGGGNSYITALTEDKTTTKTETKANTKYSYKVKSGYTSWVRKGVYSYTTVKKSTNYTDYRFIEMKDERACNGCSMVTKYYYTVYTRTDAYVTKTAWNNCPSGWTGSGTSTCKKTTKTTTTVYSCPTGYSPVAGDQTKCYKKNDLVCNCPSGYVENSAGKCEKADKIVGYSCDKGWTLDSKNKTCSRTTSSTLKKTATKNTKTVTGIKYTWSKSKTLKGWTATGKTRSVTVKGTTVK